MNIPKSIQLMGKTIKVKENAKSVRNRNNFGEADLNNLTIKISGKYSRVQVEHTFFHELVHQILWVMQEEELNANEKFVDMLGGLLHQALAPHMK